MCVVRGFTAVNQTVHRFLLSRFFLDMTSAINEGTLNSTLASKTSLQGFGSIHKESNTFKLKKNLKC